MKEKKQLTEAQKKMLKKLGLKESDVEPSEVNQEERISMIEDAFAELCDVVFGGEDDD